MSRVTCYLLACTMVLTTVMGANTVPPAFYWGIGLQCMGRGPYAGACTSQNEFGGELTCLRLACAFRRDDGSYLAVYTKPPLDGTLCGHNKVCESNVCVSKNPAEIAFPVGTAPQFDCVSSPVAKIAPYPPGSDPERNRPTLELPSVEGGEPLRFTHSNSKDHLRSKGGQHSRPVASTSKGHQRSPPAASTSKGHQRSPPAASTSKGHQRSPPAASTSKGHQRSLPAASTSKGHQRSPPAASTSKGHQRSPPAASTSKGHQRSLPAASTSKGHQRSPPAASTSKGDHSSQSVPSNSQRRH